MKQKEVEVNVDRNAINDADMKGDMKQTSKHGRRRWRGSKASDRKDYKRNHYSTTNDFTWYNNYPQFVEDAGKLAFGLPLGQPLPADNMPFNLPGLMQIYFVPGIGVSKDLRSPINRSSARFYTYLRDVQKAAAKYESADVMMYLMAIDSLYMFWAWMRRLYGVAQLFTPLNKFYPQALVDACGGNKSILNNLAEFRAYINRFAISLSAYAMPQNFEINSRHMWMCEGIFTDAPGTRAQTYIMQPYGFWKFDNTTQTGGALTFRVLPAISSLQAIQAMGDELINAITLDQDTGNISGDLYSLFGTSAMRQLPETPDMFTILPSYDETVLNQIHNATLCGDILPNTIITQDPTINNGAIIYKPKVAALYNIGGKPRFLQFPSKDVLVDLRIDSPDFVSVIEATRLTVSADPATTTGELATAPADFLCYGQIYNFSPAGELQKTTVKGGYLIKGSGSDAVPALYVISLLDKFDWAPRVFIWEAEAVGSELVFTCTGFTGDVDNITVAKQSQLELMHEATLLSLFSVPQKNVRDKYRK